MASDRIIVRRVPEPGDYGWMVIHVAAAGRRAGEEQCLALLCGGNLGKVLAAVCARQAADLKMIDLIEIEPDLATTKD